MSHCKGLLSSAMPATHKHEIYENRDRRRVRAFYSYPSTEVTGVPHGAINLTR